MRLPRLDEAINGRFKRVRAKLDQQQAKGNRRREAGEKEEPDYAGGMFA